MTTPTFSAKLPDVTMQQLAELAAQFGTSKSQVVIQAVRQLYQQEIKTMPRLANSAHSICNYCGAEYDAKYGNHLCNVDELQTLIDQEMNMTDEPNKNNIARWQVRIARVKAFWKAHPKHQGELSHQISA